MFLMAGVRPLPILIKLVPGIIRHCDCTILVMLAFHSYTCCLLKQSGSCISKFQLSFHRKIREGQQKDTAYFYLESFDKLFLSRLCLAPINARQAKNQASGFLVSKLDLENKRKEDWQWFFKRADP